MPAPGVTPALHVLHRGAARAWLCVHPHQRTLTHGLQPGVCAKEDLYEVKPERRQARAADDEEDEEAGEAEGGGSTDVLDNAWFVPASRINDYKNTEKVYDVADAGHRKLRKYERGTFIYR